MEPFDPNLRGKNIVISGASSGIGQACAILANKLGARLLLLTRSESNIEGTLSRLSGSETAFVQVVDFNQPEDAESLLVSGIESFGPIDGFIHSAGASMTRAVSSTSLDALRTLVDTNLISTYLMVKVLTKRSVFSAGGGSVVFVSSVMANVGAKGKALYGLSKGGINSFARSLSLELGARGIRVNTVSPGVVRSPLSDRAAYRLDPRWSDEVENSHPIGIGEPEDVANVCIFLLSDLSRWVTGADFVIDGGYSAR